MKRPPLFIGIVTAVAALLLVIYGLPFLAQFGAPAEEPEKEPKPRITEPGLDFGNPRVGPTDAPVKLFLYSDFGCPSCAELDDTLGEVLPEYGDDVTLVWKDLPNERLHSQARDAANAARCSGEQGAFWEYRRMLFLNQGTAEGLDYIGLARILELDLESFSGCLLEQRGDGLIQRDIDEAMELGIDATPYLIMGGKRFTGALDADRLRGEIDDALARARLNQTR